MERNVKTVEPPVDPIVLQIVEGTLASVGAEVEAAIERTSRSPMIREARDFRAGIHDRRCRKLTGRSHSALVQPIVRDFPIETMRPGDVFFHNDVYGSEGGIGHLPDLCVTVPVFADGVVVAFVQAFGHHDDIGGAVPGSMPSHATSAYQEGLIVPPVRIYQAGVPNDDLIKVLVRNSRLPDSLRGDLDSEVAACRMGPERLGELDVSEGVVPLIELRFPPPGTLLTPVFPAPTNARTFVLLRQLGILAGVIAKAVGGRMPADQETIRYTGFHGVDADGQFYLMRVVLGGGSGGRYYADGSDTIHVVPDSKNLPVEFTETRFPVVIERLALATDSGGAGTRRGGLGYLKEFRVLRDSACLCVADRAILSCSGLRGGKAGAPFRVTVDPGGPNERVLPGLVDDEPIPAGTLVRVETTGGGGWGDPLEREPELVALDVLEGKVSARAAREDYGVVLVGSDGERRVDAAATRALRDRLGAARGRRPFFDRGPGYRSLAGVDHAEVDFVDAPEHG